MLRKLFTMLRIGRRVYSPFNAMLVSGRLLRQRAIRTLSISCVALWTVLWGSSDSLVDILSTVSNMPLDILMPHMQTLLLAIGLMFPVGLLLTFAHNAIALNLERRARLNNLILTGDYKKQLLVLPYLSALWDEVYSSERLIDERLPVENREQFVTVAFEAINRAEPQALQEQRLGFPLLLAESWCRRGLFTSEDYLGDLVEYHQTLRDLRWLRYAAWQRELLALFRGEPLPSFWHSFTVKKFKMLLGRNLRELNERYAERCGRFFRAEHFVWPSRALDETVRTNHGQQALDDLLQRRYQIYLSIFGSNEKDARLQVLWMFLRDYRDVMKLRIDFDPRFVLSPQFEDECTRVETEYGVSLISARKRRKAQKRARQALRIRGQWLAKGWLNSNDGMLKRAVLVGLYAELFDSKTLNTSCPNSVKGWLEQLKLSVVKVSLGIRKVRESHVLVRHQILCYQRLTAEFLTPTIVAKAFP